EHPTRSTTEHQARRPACVQQVQVVSAVVRKECCHQRISNRLEGPVSNCKDKRSPEEKLPYRLLWHTWAGSECHKRGEHVESECGNDQLAVSDFICYDSSDNDAKAETGETSPADVAQLGRRKAKLSTPVVKDPTSNSETHTSRQDGHKACPKEPVCVSWIDAFVSTVHGFGSPSPLEGRRLWHHCLSAITAPFGFDISFHGYC